MSTAPVNTKFILIVTACITAALFSSSSSMTMVGGMMGGMMGSVSLSSAMLIVMGGLALTLAQQKASSLPDLKLSNKKPTNTKCLPGDNTCYSKLDNMVLVGTPRVVSCADAPKICNDDPECSHYEVRDNGATCVVKQFKPPSECLGKSISEVKNRCAEGYKSDVTAHIHKRFFSRMPGLTLDNLINQKNADAKRNSDLRCLSKTCKFMKIMPIIAGITMVLGFIIGPAIGAITGAAATFVGMSVSTIADLAFNVADAIWQPLVDKKYGNEQKRAYLAQKYWPNDNGYSGGEKYSMWGRIQRIESLQYYVSYHGGKVPGNAGDGKFPKYTPASDPYVKKCQTCRENQSHRNAIAKYWAKPCNEYNCTDLFLSWDPQYKNKYVDDCNKIELDEEKDLQFHDAVKYNYVYDCPAP